MPETVLRSRRGFSLIELMIAMVIILYSTLGVYGVLAFTVRSNAENSYRDEAVRVSEEVLNQLRSMPYGEVLPNTGPYPDVPGWSAADIEATLHFVGGKVERAVRRANIVYTLGVNVTSYGPPGASGQPMLKDVQVRVAWTVGEKQLAHSVGAILRDAEN